MASNIETIYSIYSATLYEDFIESWKSKSGIHSNDEILSWINERSVNLEVLISRISLDECEPWYYDVHKGTIQNPKGIFFSICGIQQYQNGKFVMEQPVLNQNEIGLLGMICCKVDGILHFLIQAKIEPGNVNKVQLSPTIQATKSNFTQQHGGRRPAYIEYFVEAKPERILVDQIQSEQSSRFLKKRNRNMIIFIDQPIPESENHKWITLGQVKDLMKQDNLVNMDTRTVLSCIPYAFMEANKDIEVIDKPMLNSLINNVEGQTIVEIYNYVNDYKMFDEIELKQVSLFALKNWQMRNDEFICENPFPFKVIFCKIAIEGREVRHWNQPLFEAIGIATFGLLCCNDNGIKKFLVKAKPEIGCFDSIELGPPIQMESTQKQIDNDVTSLFLNKLYRRENIVTDVMLSEEGGRFYHEQNRNVIINIEKQELPILPPGYFWCNFKTLNTLTQVNNCLNIQLRNLLSLLEI